MLKVNITSFDINNNNHNADKKNQRISDVTIEWDFPYLLFLFYVFVISNSWYRNYAYGSKLVRKKTIIFSDKKYSHNLPHNWFLLNFISHCHLEWPMCMSFIANSISFTIKCMQFSFKEINWPAIKRYQINVTFLHMNPIFIFLKLCIFKAHVKFNDIFSIRFVWVLFYLLIFYRQSKFNLCACVE